ncbi:hypothetical protein DRE_02395 [Drechslerella stenobrocha 248]|uniref:Uncharacterized protein n=1 Tax=Drechslerella stenobrocha 248 TaxID=1043628 RepID=W7HVS9_9PEZI|nr:hypothetical protein DRE_02395 [Drechslerella stenobrocha 248]
MPSTTSNIITTTLLTLVCAAALFLSYRHAIRPILNRYNIPLQSLPSIITNRSRGWMDTNYHRLDPDNVEYDSDNETIDATSLGQPAGGRRLSRDLEEGFRDSDSDEEGDRRLGGQTRLSTNSNPNSTLRELPPTPVDDSPRRQFPATRI